MSRCAMCCPSRLPKTANARRASSLIPATASPSGSSPSSSSSDGRPSSGADEIDLEPARDDTHLFLPEAGDDFELLGSLRDRHALVARHQRLDEPAPEISRRQRMALLSRFPLDID